MVVGFITTYTITQRKPECKEKDREPEEYLSTRETLNVKGKPECARENVNVRRKPEYQGKPECKEEDREPDENLSTRENLNVKRETESQKNT
jgi:hypothetical protein